MSKPTTDWKFDYELRTMMWYARCPLCKRAFPLGETPGESYLLHKAIEEGRVGLACVDNGKHHWGTAKGRRVTGYMIDGEGVSWKKTPNNHPAMEGARP